MAKILIALVAVMVALAGAALWLDHAASNNADNLAPAGIEASAGAIYAAKFADVDGKEQMLGQWQNKLLVMNFWATWCAPCREEMPLLSKLQEEYAMSGVQVIGIAADSRLNVVNFSQKSPVGYPLFPDEAGAIEFSRRLGNRQGLLPYTLVVRPPGEVVYANFGPVTEGEMRKIIIKNIKSR